MNAYPNGEKFYRQSRRLAEELKPAGAETEIRLNGGIEATIRTDGAADCIGGFDFAVYLDKDKYLGRMLELAGLRLFNCADAVEKCDDKMLTYLALVGAGLCVPETIWRHLRRRRRNFCMLPIFISDISPLRRAATSV